MPEKFTSSIEIHCANSRSIAIFHRNLLLQGCSSEVTSFSHFIINVFIEMIMELFPILLWELWDWFFLRQQSVWLRTCQWRVASVWSFKLVITMETNIGTLNSTEHVDLGTRFFTFFHRNVHSMRWWEKTLWFRLPNVAHRSYVGIVLSWQDRNVKRDKYSDPITMTSLADIGIVSDSRHIFSDLSTA